MSRFLKIIVNVILICAILVAGALLIPSFAGIPMVVVDDVNMDTNLPRGSVTYAQEVDAEEISTGDNILMAQDGGQYVYQVQGISGETYTLEDTRSTDGQTRETQLTSPVEKVVMTVPFIGYASMALRTTEGLIVVGLAVVFVIILFILAEIWKKDDDEDEDEEDAEPEEAEDEDEEIAAMSRKEARRQKKAERKREKKARRAARASLDDEDEDEDDIRIAEPVKKKRKPVVQEAETEEETSGVGKDLFEETESSLASDVAAFMSDISREEAEGSPESLKTVLEEDQEDGDGSWKPAMPVRTKEELLRKARAEGDEPEVKEDEISGVTIIDYSDIL